MHELQRYGLEMLKTFDAFCREHSLPYYLGEGTLLGAVRHGGYIPWDDDVDVMMLREDYDRFVRLAREHYPAQHVLDCIDTNDKHWSICAKLQLARQTPYYLARFAGLALSNNPCIDIFPLDHVASDHGLRLWWQAARSRLYRRVLWVKLGVHNCFTHKTLTGRLTKFYPFKLLSLFFSKDFLQRHLESTIRAQNRNTNAAYVANFGSLYPVKREVWPVSWFEPVPHRFEDLDSFIPAGYDALLRRVYGDYMQLPPAEDRVPKHNYARRIGAPGEDEQLRLSRGETVKRRLQLTVRRIRKKLVRPLRLLVVVLGKRFPGIKHRWNDMIIDRRRARYQRLAATISIDHKLVFFQSFMGRGYTDSPKALYRAMLADPRFDDYRFVWAFRDPKKYRHHPDMKRAQVVRHNSDEFYQAFAAAGTWIMNLRIHAWVDPKPGQVFVQTWHGTPLKRIGCDIEVQTAGAISDNQDLAEKFRIDSPKQTWFLSPSEFASDCFRTAFDMARYHDHDIIIQEGYPRNDFLVNYTPHDVAAIKKRLLIPDDKKVLLYAPTWRDDQHDARVGYTFRAELDFDRLQEELGDDWVVLFRAHYYVASSFDFSRYLGFVYDVSGEDDISELYVVSDVLVTDYSSSFFDYAVLGRPILFYMYDYEFYAGQLRGFYLSLDGLPGPISQTQDALLDDLARLDEISGEYAERYAAFRARYCALDDGHVSERVLQRVFFGDDAAGTGDVIDGNTTDGGGQ